MSDGAKTTKKFTPMFRESEKIAAKKKLSPKEVEERLVALRHHSLEKDYNESHKLLTEIGVPEWVEVMELDGFLMPGNSLSHRLRWYLRRRQPVSAHESKGVCEELNQLEARFAREHKQTTT